MKQFQHLINKYYYQPRQESMSDFHWSNSGQYGPLSAYNSVQMLSPTSSNRQRSLPDLPLSPIKNIDTMRTERSLMEALENRRLTFNKNNSVSRKTPNEQYSIFHHRLHQGFDVGEENNSLQAEDVQGKDLYDKVVEIRKYIRHGKSVHKKAHKTYSTFRSPAQSFELCKDIETVPHLVVEAPRNTVPSSKSSPVNSSHHLVEQLLDVNLKSYDDIDVGNRALNYSTKAVETTPGLKYRHKSSEQKPSLSCKDLSELSPRDNLHMGRRSLSPIRQSNSYSRPSRSDVNKIVRGLFYNVDEIPHKGNIQKTSLQQNSQSVRNLINGPRSTSRPHFRTESTDRKLSKQSPVKPPPFCSTISNTDYSQAVHANEQQLIRLVNTHFPQWRIFVRNLLADSNIENDVACNFLQEIENRHNSKELASKFNSDPRVDEFNQTDEKILTKLREKICRGSSRIHQLRILQQVLRSSC